MNTIETGDVEKITERLNPRALTKCKTNTLYMAMKVDDTESLLKEEVTSKTHIFFFVNANKN